MRRKGGREGCVDRGREETERASAGRTDGGIGRGGGSHEVKRGEHPGPRKRCLRMEKRVRAAHYARDASRSSCERKREGEGRARVEMKRDGMRIVAATGNGRREEREDRREERA